MKTSLDDDRHDYYDIGSYDELNAKWVPDNPGNDVGIGITYDYRIFYASKVFYDQSKQRRVLWGWIGESDSEATDVRKGWASLRVCSEEDPARSPNGAMPPICSSRNGTHCSDSASLRCGIQGSLGCQDLHSNESSSEHWYLAVVLIDEKIVHMVDLLSNINHTTKREEDIREM
ncbi:Acid beta-fructofuranosidase 2, vacuolar, partial [Linum perenne]